MPDYFTAIHPSKPLIASDLNDANTIKQAWLNPAVKFTM